MPSKKKEIFIQSHVDKFVEEKRSKSTKQAKDRYKTILQEYVNEFTSGYTPKKKNIDNVGAEVFGRSFESIKHTIPEYELDIELIHNVVRAELAVIKAEEEKKAADEQRENAIMERSRFICFSTFINDDGGFYENIKDIPLPTEWYSYKYLNKKLKQLKGQYTKYIIKSIILSLGLGATIMYIILNNL